MNIWVISGIITLITLLFLIYTLYRKNPHRYYILEGGKRRFDYNLLCHIIFNAVIFGGSTSVSLGLILFGFSGEWPKQYILQMGQGAIIFSALIFMIFCWKYVDDFIQSKIEEEGAKPRTKKKGVPNATKKHIEQREAKVK